MSLLDKIGLADKINFDDWYNTFLSLEKKQQTAVSVGIAVVLLIVLSLPVGCISSKMSEKEEEYQKHLRMASKFFGVQQEYARLQAGLEQVRKSSKTFGSDPLKGILYTITDEVGIERKLVTPKTVAPIKTDLFTELGKDVTIANVQFDQMVKLLEKLVVNDKIPIKIKKLNATAEKKDRKVIKKLTFTMTTLKPNK